MRIAHNAACHLLPLFLPSLRSAHATTPKGNVLLGPHYVCKMSPFWGSGRHHQDQSSKQIANSAKNGQSGARLAATNRSLVGRAWALARHWLVGLLFRCSFCFAVAGSGPRWHGNSSPPPTPPPCCTAPWRRPRRRRHQACCPGKQSAPCPLAGRVPPAPAGRRARRQKPGAKKKPPSYIYMQPVLKYLYVTSCS